MGISFIWDLYETAPAGLLEFISRQEDSPRRPNGRPAMSDFLYVLAGLAFFALAILYVTATERL